MNDAKKTGKKAGKKQQKEQQTSDNSNSRRNLWIALAVLAVLAAVLWYLHDQGYLRRWFSTTGGRRSRQNFSPSAPPFPN